MGSCLSRSSFTVNKRHTAESIRFEAEGCPDLTSVFLSAGPDDQRTYPVVFSMVDTETVLREADPGTYLLYKDFESDKIYLSLRVNSRIRHHRISEMNGLFYLERQPYPYLDSIIFYHRRHKLKGVRLQQQAHLSARVVKAFSHKIAAANGNLPLTVTNGNLPPGVTVANGNLPFAAAAPLTKGGGNQSLAAAVVTNGNASLAAATHHGGDVSLDVPHSNASSTTTSASTTPRPSIQRASRRGSLASLITSSSDCSTAKAAHSQRL